MPTSSSLLMSTCFSRGIELDDVLRFLLIPVILWIYRSCAHEHWSCNIMRSQKALAPCMWDVAQKLQNHQSMVLLTCAPNSLFAILPTALFLQVPYVTKLVLKTQINFSYFPKWLRDIWVTENESQDDSGWKGMQEVNLPIFSAQEGLPTADCVGPGPGKFWISPSM